MNPRLQADLEQFEALLARAQRVAVEALASLETRAVNPRAPDTAMSALLPETGRGTAAVLEQFATQVAPWLSGSTGPRYLGFVTGGATPAALVGDWLCSAFDQNAADADTISERLELETLDLLRQLLRLPESFTGSFVSGATMSNFVGLALGRQWIGDQHGVDIASAGLRGLPAIRVLAATPHSSALKALSMLGLGREALQLVPTLPGREAMDVSALRQQLEHLGAPCIVVASSGTVNTTDFDDLRAIAALQESFPFWLHVDAAFGGFAATSPRLAPLVAGFELADSLTVDAHKWLNVPYDSAMQFTRHQSLQLRVFQNSGAAYLGEVAPAFVHLTPENSRRWRALPAWFSLQAYGLEGQRSIVEGNCDLAASLGERIRTSSEFELLSEVRLNVVCFRPHPIETALFLERLRASGAVFMTPTNLRGVSAARAAFSNWRTSPEDLEIT